MDTIRQAFREARPSSTLARYAIGVLTPFLGLLLRAPLEPLIEAKVPYSTFFFATAVSAGLAGVGPGLITTGIGALLVTLFITPSRSPFLFSEPADYFGLLIFLGVSSFISYTCGALLTLRQKAEEQRQIFEQTLSGIGEGVISTDANGRVVFMNGVAERLTGWTLQEARGLPSSGIFKLVEEDTLKPTGDPVTLILGRKAAKLEVRRKSLMQRSGIVIPIDDSAAPIRDSARRIRGVVVVFRDIRSQRAAEERARRDAAEMAWLAAIVESTQDAIISKDLEGIVTSWNKGAERMFGYSSEEMIGNPAQMLASPYREYEMPAVMKRLQRGERVETYEAVRCTKTGREIHVSLTVSPIKDADGVITGVSKLARDITAQARQAAQLARTNGELRQFAYAASHDLQEPLRTIATFAEALSRQEGASLRDKSAQYLQFILDGSQRMKRLVDALLEYSKAGEDVEPLVVSAENALSAALANLGTAINQSRASVTHDTLPEVLGSELQFTRLLQNLISNGIKYRREDASVKIHVSAERRGEEWRFSVADNGQGIPLEYQEQIFGIFKRLHGQEYPGSGIGLASCKRIVERFGGRIWVESQIGEGSTFFFTSPGAPRT